MISDPVAMYSNHAQQNTKPWNCLQRSASHYVPSAGSSPSRTWTTFGSACPQIRRSAAGPIAAGRGRSAHLGRHRRDAEPRQRRALTRTQTVERRQHAPRIERCTVARERIRELRGVVRGQARPDEACSDFVFSTRSQHARRRGGLRTWCVRPSRGPPAPSRAQGVPPRARSQYLSAPAGATEVHEHGANAHIDHTPEKCLGETWDPLRVPRCVGAPVGMRRSVGPPVARSLSSMHQEASRGRQSSRLRWHRFGQAHVMSMVPRGLLRVPSENRCPHCAMKQQAEGGMRTKPGDQTAAPRQTSTARMWAWASSRGQHLRLRLSMLARASAGRSPGDARLLRPRNPRASPCQWLGLLAHLRRCRRPLRPAKRATAPAARATPAHQRHPEHPADGDQSDGRQAGGRERSEVCARRWWEEGCVLTMSILGIRIRHFRVVHEAPQGCGRVPQRRTTRTSAGGAYNHHHTSTVWTR
jgi:hypothetical protein